MAMRAYYRCTTRLSGVASEETMSFEEGDCFRSPIQWKSSLRFEGEAQIVGGVLELAAD